MFKDDKINVPVLGIVENMSWFTPADHPDEKYYIFGKGGGKDLADKLGVKLLVQIPLVAGICEDVDNGKPTSTNFAANALTGAEDSRNNEAIAFALLADSIVSQCDERNRNLPPTQKVEVKK